MEIDNTRPSEPDFTHPAPMEVVTATGSRRGETEITRRQSETNFRQLFEIMSEGVVLYEVLYTRPNDVIPRPLAADEPITDGMVAVDYIILHANPAYYRDMGLDPSQSVEGQLASSILHTPDQLDRYYAAVAKTGKPASFLEYIEATKRYFKVNVRSTEQGQFMTVLADVTQLVLERELLDMERQRLDMERQRAQVALRELALVWVNLLETKNLETADHSDRVAITFELLAKALGLDDATISQQNLGARLHDIGKIGIRDDIFLEPGKLSPEKRLEMNKHTTIGKNLLEKIKEFRVILDIPYCHHERWDGTGYPQGLTGNDIPQVARIFSLVDVMDALTSPRHYRTVTWPLSKVATYIQNESGKQFDPLVCRVLLFVIDQIVTRSNEGLSDQGELDRDHFLQAWQQWTQTELPKPTVQAAIQELKQATG